jgi:uncharacterized membrane protein YgaE (UPF0421/DUF939 family)
MTICLVVCGRSLPLSLCTAAVRTRRVLALRCRVQLQLSKALSAVLAYLLFFPFHVIGMVALIGIIAIILALVRRSEDIVMAAITPAVVLVIAGISPENAWIQPILRLVDTAVGISVGIASLVDKPRLGSEFEPGARRRVRAAPGNK